MADIYSTPSIMFIMLDNNNIDSSSLLQLGV